MSCKHCQPLIDSNKPERERSEMEEVFEIIQETQDKFDSCTMWWHGEARCSQCHQKVSFDYRSGYQNTGDIRVA